MKLKNICFRIKFPLQN